MGNHGHVGARTRGKFYRDESPLEEAIGKEEWQRVFTAVIRACLSPCGAVRA